MITSFNLTGQVAVATGSSRGFGRYNVRVNAICPGVIRTDFARAIWEEPEAQAHVERTTPLARLREPADVAGATLFLASPAARFVTGQSIVVDGGIMAGSRL